MEAFRTSVRRAFEFLKTFESYILDGKVLDSASFQKAMRYLEREDVEDDATPRFVAADLDAHEEARSFLSTLPSLDASQYDLRRLHEALQHDIDVLTEVWHDIKRITPDRDASLDTPRVVGDADVFQIQDKVIKHIVSQSKEQRAIEEAPRILDRVQTTLVAVLRGYLNRPDLDRGEIKCLIRSLSQPLPGVHIRALRKAHQDFAGSGDIYALVEMLQQLPLDSEVSVETRGSPDRSVTREDLHLVCFDFVWS